MTFPRTAIPGRAGTDGAGPEGASAGLCRLRARRACHTRSCSMPRARRGWPLLLSLAALALGGCGGRGAAEALEAAEPYVDRFDRYDQWARRTIAADPAIRGRS